MLESALAQGGALLPGDITGTQDAFFGDPFLVSSAGESMKISMKEAMRGKVLTLELK
jgi:hypothetical protein